MCMHESMNRLYTAIWEKYKIRGKSNVAYFLNQSPQTIDNWEKRGAAKAGLIKANERLGYNLLWLLTGEGEPFDKPVESVAPSGFMNLSLPKNNSISKVPLVSWVKAGEFCENFDYIEDDGIFVETAYRARSRTFALTVNGLSMWPKFPDGCTIIVEPDEEPVNGKFVIVRQNANSEATFKQLQIDGDQKYLVALNPDWPNRIIQMMPDAVICGVVKKIEQDV